MILQVIWLMSDRMVFSDSDCRRRVVYALFILVSCLFWVAVSFAAPEEDNSPPYQGSGNITAEGISDSGLLPDNGTDSPGQVNAANSSAENLSDAPEHLAATVHIEGQSPQLKKFWDNHRDVLPWDYAYVEDIPSPVFKAPLPDTEGIRPVRMLDGGKGTFRWVSLEQPEIINAGGLQWYNINPDEYVEARHLKKFWASDFHGINLKEHPLDGRYGWVVFDAYTSTKPGREEFFDGMLLKKHTLVRLYETRHINGWDWHRVGENQWLEQRRIAKIVDEPRPESIPADARWIDINLYEQTISAYEGDRKVYVSLVSSGLPDFDTPTGLYRIWAKVRFAKMSGGEKGENFYYLEDVPYHMYFFNGYAIHGAYWHNNFGVKQSHGCVNISCLDAAWFFEWTRPEAPGDKWKVNKKAKDATWVWIHDKAD